MKYRILGLEKETFEKIYQINKKNANEINSQSCKPLELQWDFWIGEKIFSNDLASVCSYLYGDIAMAKNYTEHLLCACELLFWGEWRNLPNEKATKVHVSPQQYAQKETPWMEPFLHCTAFAFALGNNSEAKKIASYPSEECEDLMLGAKAEDKYLYLLLAQWIASETWNAKFETIVLAGKKKSPKMVLPVLASLRDGDQEMYHKSFLQYMAHFKKYEFSNHYFDEILSYMGTILYYLGVQRGFVITDPKILENPYLILGL